MPVMQFRAERLAWARMSIKFINAIRDAITQVNGGKPVDYETAMVCAAVIEGHAAGKPMIASSVARSVKLKNETARRKLAKLEEWGIVVRRDKLYFLAPQLAKSKPVNMAKYMKIFDEAVDALGKNRGGRH